jgi:DNA-binding transcriptional ArsR family regulator
VSTLAHAYRYAFASALDRADQGHSLRLATSGGAEPSPYFFRGLLARPRRTADLLLAVAEVASSRFFLPGALRNIDPVVTSGGERLRFEAFSSCCGVYARCDLRPEAIEGDWLGRGTTNVDFNEPMRAALAGVRDDERVSLNVGAQAVELERDGASVVERKVKLPTRWLKGFVEVQCYQAAMKPAVELAAADAYRFLASLPHQVPMSSLPSFAVPHGRTLRISQREAPGAIALGGPARLRILARLVRGARTLRIYAHDDGASAWELVFDDTRFHLVLSPDASRGFSGEGQALKALAGDGGASLPRVRAALHWQARLRPEDLARQVGLEQDAVGVALAQLGSRGLVGYDLDEGAWFHRELPFDLGAVEELQPRLLDARALVANGGVRVLPREGDHHEVEVLVQGTGVEHVVRLRGEDERCTCPWYSRNQGARGPCKHILAAHIALGDAPSDGAQDGP